MEVKTNKSNHPNGNLQLRVVPAFESCITAPHSSKYLGRYNLPF